MLIYLKQEKDKIMRFLTIITVIMAVACCVTATAELQNVEVGGSIRIRANYFNLDSLGDHSFIEQRTRLGVKADFTDEVSTFIEFDNYNWWGEDFRSNYLTGADLRGGMNNVNLYQGYIDVQNLWGSPLSLRVGRQEFRLGAAFFIGTNESSAFFQGLSFDAIRLTYTHDLFVVNAVAAKTVERFSDFMKDDADLYGVYFSYLGIEDVTLDAYWLYARDRVGAIGTDVDLHVLGLRGAGTIGAFDFDAEVAYQFGNVDGMPSACPLGFGEADVNFDELGVNLEAGYTFDAAWQPRLFARFAYLGGGNPDDCAWSNDFDMPFIRLTSDIKYSQFLDNNPNSPLKASLSNVFFYSLGVEAMPTECLELSLAASYFDVDQEAYDGASSNLGWEVGLYADYHYSEDLVVRSGYAHFFGNRGLEGNMIVGSGLAPWLGDRDDDYDYMFLETELKF
jgi:hypothetical protein